MVQLVAKAFVVLAGAGEGARTGTGAEWSSGDGS
jgi:hypothetical protein